MRSSTPGKSSKAFLKFKSVLVVLPTGCGKTVVFASVIRRLMTAEVKAKGVGEQWKVHFSQAARTPLPLCVFALIVSDFSGRGLNLRLAAVDLSGGGVYSIKMEWLNHQDGMGIP